MENEDKLIDEIYADGYKPISKKCERCGKCDVELVRYNPEKQVNEYKCPQCEQECRIVVLSLGNRVHALESMINAFLSGRINENRFKSSYSNYSSLVNQ